MRTIIVVIYVFLFLILGLPVLGIEWIIAKFDKHAADISQLRIVQWGLRCVSFLAGVHLTVGKRTCTNGSGCTLYWKSPQHF